MKQTIEAKHLMEQINTAILSFDDQLRLKYINSAGEMLLASSMRSILGQKTEQLFPLSPKFTQSLHNSMNSGRPYTEGELHLNLPNMRAITVNCTVTPLDNNSPQGSGLILEMARVDRQLRIAREENLLAQNHTTKTLIRVMAHEIKNPLGGIRGAAQLLERELPNENLKEYTQVIIDEADRLRNLLNRMLGSNTPPQKSMTNIHAVLERVRTLVKAEAPDNITFIRDYDPSIPEVYADPDQLIQAILNIVRNAVQAISANNDRGTIKLRSRSESQVTLGPQHHRLVIRLEIIDDGPGIPKDIHETIFYPMVTGRHDGTGLGLPIAQTLINQHDGLIECDRQDDHTIFTLFLPLERDNEQ